MRGKLRVNIHLATAKRATDLDVSIIRDVVVVTVDGEETAVRHELSCACEEDPESCTFDVATQMLTLTLNARDEAPDALTSTGGPPSPAEANSSITGGASMGAAPFSEIDLGSSPVRVEQVPAHTHCEAAAPVGRGHVQTKSRANALLLTMQRFAQTLHCGRGLVSTRAIKAGELVLSSAALSPVVTDTEVHHVVCYTVPATHFSFAQIGKICSTCFREHAEGFRFGCSVCGLASFCSAACRETSHPPTACSAIRKFSTMPIRSPSAALTRWPLNAPLTYGRAMIQHFCSSGEAAAGRGSICSDQLLSRGNEPLPAEETAFISSLSRNVSTALEHVGVYVEAASVAALVERWLANAYEIVVGGNTVGFSLFPTAAMANHACNPSCLQLWHDGCLDIRAIRDIEEGEPVTVLYCSPFAPRAERQASLRRLHLFDCACQRCVDVAMVSRDKQQVGFCCTKVGCDGCLCHNNARLVCDVCSLSCDSTPLMEAATRVAAVVENARKLFGIDGQGHQPGVNLSAQDQLAAVAKGTAILSTMFQQQDAKTLYWCHHTLRTAHNLLARAPLAFSEAPPMLLHVGVQHATSLLRILDHIFPDHHPTKGEVLQLRGEQWSKLSACEPEKADRQICLERSIDDFAAAVRLFGIVTGSDSRRTAQAEASHSAASHRRT